MNIERQEKLQSASYKVQEIQSLEEQLHANGGIDRDTFLHYVIKRHFFIFSSDTFKLNQFRCMVVTHVKYMRRMYHFVVSTAAYNVPLSVFLSQIFERNYSPHFILELCC
jgi:hypothetical protein